MSRARTLEEYTKSCENSLDRFQCGLTVWKCVSPSKMTHNQIIGPTVQDLITAIRRKYGTNIAQVLEAAVSLAAKVNDKTRRPTRTS